MSARAAGDPLASFHPALRSWFFATFSAPTLPQALAWPPIARGESTLVLAPTGTGKTLAAFLWCLDRLMFAPMPPKDQRCRVLYVSPLKALAVDIERNLQGPLAGIALSAERASVFHLVPTVALRTGDTPAAERSRFLRHPADILITTPESLYLLLTSNSREALRSVDTIIIDEIHALVPTKRGAHLAVSIERLAARCARAPQRIGLSATQRPLDEVARFLGGVDPNGRRLKERRRSTNNDSTKSDVAASRRDIDDEFASPHGDVPYRKITIVDAGAKKGLKLSIETPIEDMPEPPPQEMVPTRREDAAGAEPRQRNTPPSVWTAIHSTLLDLIRTHRSTLVFVNSRRLAERLSGAINELAGEILVRSHHGSIARAQRLETEDLLKRGALRALIATSSLELGIDMGAIDLVVQIEAPPSVASGLQRIGRAGHRIDAVSEGVIFPKYRGDLLACAAVARAMHEGTVEATRYPRNPLDILAQQLVAMTALDRWNVDDLFETIRLSAPFAELSRRSFEGVLDMLSGRYPSDEFAELRPRITWDRIAGTVVAREGSRRVAVANGGTIPDRGLYGVFLLGAGPGTARVGELDEEMVFESRVGETFVLGASSWRIEDITHDRVLVSPAPGEPGKMPFWKGDRAGRPIELGLAIGNLVQHLMRMSPGAAADQLIRRHDLDGHAAETLLQYLRDQVNAIGTVPDAKTVVIERVRDELGDWRVCVLSPRGGRVHAPWAMAAAACIRDATGVDVEMLWGDDGFVVRFPDTDRPPDPALLIPDPGHVQKLVVRQLGATALFAAKFRENAARSLLLPKRRPGMRAPLWQQRKKAADLLAVASRFGSFPVLLETYRECLRDYFDMPALVQTLTELRSRAIRVVTADSDKPSPFAASLLFSYVASFLYDGDAPLAERRAQALVVDQSQLQELVGDAELRELLDADALQQTERRLQRLDPSHHAKSADAIHDMLIAIGDLTENEIRERSVPEAAGQLEDLERATRIVRLPLANELRYIAVEDAARYRDAVGAMLPPGIPQSLLVPVQDPLGDLALRYARTHAPFPSADFASRYGLTLSTAETTLARLRSEKRLLEGEFRPGGTHREWTDPGVLRIVRRASLARLRHEVEPVDPATLGRLVTTWQGVVKRRQGTDALLDTIEQLQGAPLPASIIESEILAARLQMYEPADLDILVAAGEVVWVGLETLGERDGRIALYLADHVSRLLPPAAPVVRNRSTATSSRPPVEPDARQRAIIDWLRSRGASFFAALHEAAGGGYPAETVDALWQLVWQGIVTNDAFQALRAFTRPPGSNRRDRRADPTTYRSQRLVPPTAAGRWSLVRADIAGTKPIKDATHWATAEAEQLLARHGVLTREVVLAESTPGGFGLLYPVLRAMEERGRVRRGYFVAGLGAAQFALPGALDLLRSLRVASEDPEVAVLAAVDPANPYGATLKWPDGGGSDSARAPSRTVGAAVILVDGSLAGYLARGDRHLLTWLPEAEPERSRISRSLARALVARARSGDPPQGMLIETIDGGQATAHPLTAFLKESGFIAGALGMQAILPRTPANAPSGSRANAVGP
jgi:ATP-dependent Lhr-like helicase